MADTPDFAHTPPDQVGAYQPVSPNDDQTFAAFKRKADVETDVRAIEKGMGNRTPGTRIAPRFVGDDD
jgi:hypothetical protein